MRNLTQDFQVDIDWQLFCSPLPAVITSCSFMGRIALAVGAQGHKGRGSDREVICFSE